MNETPVEERWYLYIYYDISLDSEIKSINYKEQASNNSLDKKIKKNLIQINLL